MTIYTSAQHANLEPKLHFIVGLLTYIA